MKLIKNYFSLSKSTYLISLVLLTLSVLMSVVASVLLSNILNAIIDQSYTSVMFYITVEIIVWIVLLLCNYGSEIFQARTMKNVNLRIKDTLANKITEFEEEEYYSKSSDSYVSLFVNDTELVENNLFENHFKLIHSIEMVLFSFCTLLYFNVLLAISSIVFFLLMYYTPKLFENYSQKNLEQLSKAKELFLNNLKNQLNGFNVYSTHNLLSRMRVNINLNSRLLEKDKYSYSTKLSLISLVLGFINVVAQLGNIIICALLSMMGVISTGIILSVGNLSGLFYNSLLTILNLKILMKSSEALLNKLDTIRCEDTMIKQQCGNIEQISLENVSFSYSDKEVFKDKNFVFEKGKKYLLVGNNGSGKSTLFKIIAQKLSHYEGNVLVNGVNSLNYDKGSIKEKIGYIEQNPYLFNDSILYNICLGCEVDEINLKKVIKQCCLESFINEKGLDYIIDENSNNISGGQKQKIALARALIQGCRFILFDEASSNLDKTAKEDINKILTKDETLTVVMIDHHLNQSESNHFDCVYSMN